MIFGLYDVAALGPRARPPSTWARWSVGVVSFAWSNFLTLGPLAGPALRLWLYRSLGIPGDRARSALTAVLVALSLGLLVWCGAVSLPVPSALDTFGARVLISVPLGALACFLLRSGPRLFPVPRVLRRFDGMPGALIVVAVAPWVIARGGFHLALNGRVPRIHPRLTPRAFFLRQLIGVMGFFPGGVGAAAAYWCPILRDSP